MKKLLSHMHIVVSTKYTCLICEMLGVELLVQAWHLGFAGNGPCSSSGKPCAPAALILPMPWHMVVGEGPRLKSQSNNR